MRQYDAVEPENRLVARSLESLGRAGLDTTGLQSRPQRTMLDEQTEPNLDFGLESRE